MITYPTNKLQKVILGGGCEQRNLPSGYTQVAYLESDGTQYIDTGITPTVDTNFETEFIITAGGSCAVFHTYIDTATSRYGIISDPSYGLFVNNGGNYSTNQYEVVRGDTYLNNKYCIKLENKSVYVNGNLVKTNLGTTFNTNLTLCMFGNNRNGVYENCLKGKIYYLKLYNNNEILRNYIPARRNSDNVLGMYDLVSNAFLTNQGTGTFTAGADVVPTPDEPIDIVCNNGVLKYNPNLHSVQYHDGILSDVNGTSIQIKEGFNSSTMINCTTIKSFVVDRSVSGKFRLFKYRSDESFIDALMVYNFGDTITLDNNCGYFRVQYGYSDSAEVIIYDSSHNFGIYTNGTVETVEATGKNLFDSPNIINGKRLSIDLNMVYSSAADSYSAVDCFISNLIPVEIGKTYIKNSPLADAYHRFKVYNANKVAVRIASENSITIQSDEAYIAFCGYLTELDSTTLYDSVNIQTATAEMLLAVGDYKDVQSVLDGKVTRNVEIKVLDGSENWVKGGDYDQFYSQDAITDRNYSLGSIGYCTHFTMGSDVTDLGKYGYMRFGSVTQQINFSSVGLSATTVAEWKQFLADQYNAGTPVIIVYPLAEPNIEQVTPQPLSGNTATVIAGSIDNLPIESSTIAELKKRYIGDKEVKRVYIGDNLIFANNDFYGVKINYSTGVIERIGRMEWHRTLPILSQMRRVSILTDGTVRELTNSNVNDLDADIMVEIPEHYSQTYREIKNGVTYDYIKLYPYAHIGLKVPKHYHGAFKAALNRSNNQLRSVITVDINNCDITDGTNLSYVTGATTYRGGNNQDSWDSLTKSQLGMPVTYKSIADFATYGTNRGSKYAMLNWAARNVLLRLFIVEYATLHSQASFNPNLDSNGYHQGGLGDGVTTLDGSAWNNFNSYYPVVPCGVTYSLGNNTGVVTYTLRAAIGSVAQVSVPSYRGVESPFGDIWEICNGVYINGANSVNNIYTRNDGIYTRNWQYNNLAEYTLKSNTLALREGWITDWVWDSDGEFLPTANTSNASNTQDTLSPLRDYSWAANTGNKRLMVGGCALIGVRAGLACFGCSGAVGIVIAHNGSRLLRLS